MIEESKAGGKRDELRDTSQLCGAIFVTSLIRGFCSTGSSRQIYPGDRMSAYAFVDSLDLKGMGFKERASEEGRPSYGADLLLKVWLYGYFESMRSSPNLDP